MAVGLDVKVKLEKFYELFREDVRAAFNSLRVDGAVIFNNSDANVTFYVYNYADSVYWISAHKVLVAPGAHGVVAASGSFFKVHPNDDRESGFLVAPFNAYVYHGPGNVEKVTEKSGREEA